MSRLIRYRDAIYRRAQDEEEEDSVDEVTMVQELEEAPAAHWKDYEQPIIRALNQQLGTPVTLKGPRMEARPGGPQLGGFDIVGHLGFPEGRPPEIAEQYGDGPVSFTAYILPDGKLSQHIQVGPSLDL